MASKISAGLASQDSSPSLFLDYSFGFSRTSQVSCMPHVSTVSFQPGAALSWRQREASAPINTVDLSPDLRILLTSARLQLTSAQEERLQQLCEQILDWPKLIDLADRLLMLPLAYRHLRSLPANTVSAEHLSSMRQSCQARILRLIAMAAEQRRLVQQVLHPLNISYAFFKGPSLALRYYGELGLRQYRDLDVLVAPKDMATLVMALVDRGYVTQPQVLEGAALAFTCRYLAGEMKLLSPRGIVIELHPWLDRKGCIFPTSSLLAQAESFPTGEMGCRVLPTTALFVYICYHHSRHQWSRLHWLADLDALQRHPSFDLSAVQALAKQLGLQATVNAALSLYQVCGQAEPEAVDLVGLPERTMRDACLQSLVTGQERKTAQRSTVDFSFAWQVKYRYLWSLLTAYLRPTYSDYQALPLPRPLYPLYYLMRPLRAGWIVVRRRVWP